MENDLKAKIKVAEAKLIESKENLRRPAQLEAELLAQIKVAESEAAQAKRNSKRTVIIAPQYHGRITEKRVDIGQVVNANTILATAIATDYAEVRLPISNHRLSYLDVPEQLVSTNDTQALINQPKMESPPVTLTAQIGVDAYNWPGKIDRAEGRYDATSQQLFLIAQVPEPYGRKPALRAGLFVRADITGKTLNNIFILPRHTVRRGDEVALAIKKGDKTTLIRQKIEILWRDEKVMITRSLKAGDILITTPIEYATDGQQLTIAVDGKAPPAPKGQRPGKGGGKNGPMKGKKGKGSGSKKGKPAA
jgi:RND family efflux transporter MFP subunit